MSTRLDPVLEMTDMARTVARLLGEPMGTATRGAIPVDVMESRDAVSVTAYFPGLAREDVEVELTAGVLVLRAERSLPADGDVQLLHVESPYGRLERRLTVGTGVRGDAATATWREGALTIRLPKSDALRTRRIEITEAAAPPALSDGAGA